MMNWMKFLVLAVFLAVGSVQTVSADGWNRGVVSSATPEATAAGVYVLRKGGNAVDAAVAVAFALGVTEPAGSGLGGQTQIILHPASGDPVVINGTSFSPAYLPEEVQEDQLKSGYTASTVPSTVRVLDFAHTKYGSGTIPWKDLLAPAVRYAREGFVVGGFRHRSFVRHAGALQRNPVTAKYYLHKDGRPYAEGEVFRQPVLARTLRRLADKGAADFYAGGIAQDIAADMKKNGGWITLEDLRAVPEPRVMVPLTTTYRGWTVHTLPPPAGGWVVLLALNILENVPQDALDMDDDRRALHLLEVLRVAQGNRRNEPVEDLVNFRDIVGRKIDKATARALFEKMQSDGGETTHFSVTDGSGMMVSVTQSIDSYFGSKAANEKLGFLYNNYMQAFETGTPDHPFALRPRAMPYSSMSATILARDGKPHMAVGSPGSARIISAVIQVVSHWVDVGKGIVPAVDALRVHVVPDNRAYIERLHVDNALLLELANRGFDLRRPFGGTAAGELDPYFGGVHAVALEDGRQKGAADPRRDGAVGYVD